MTESSSQSPESLIPVVRYRDIAASAAWLCSAFGFQQKSLVATEDGTAIYAELAHGRGTLMLVPVGQSELDTHMRQPDEIDGVETQTCYVTIADADIHYHRAVDQGAEIILPLSSDNSGQRGYTCRDCEGHIWSFGTYAPAHHRLAEMGDPMPSYLARPLPPGAPKRGRRAAAILLPVSLAAIAAAVWFVPGNPFAGKGQALLNQLTASSYRGDIEPAAEPSTSGGLFQPSLRQAEDTILKLRQEISDTKETLAKTRDSATGYSRDLSAEYAKRTAAEKLADDNRKAREKAEAAQAAASQALARIETELHKERSARGAAVQASEKVREQLDAELAKHIKSEQAARAAPAVVAAPDATVNKSAPTAKLPSVSTPALDTASKAEPQTKPGAKTVAATPASAPPAAAPAETGSVEPTPNAPKPALLKSAVQQGDTDQPSAMGSKTRGQADKPAKTASRNKASRPEQKSALKRHSGGEKTWPYSEW